MSRIFKGTTLMELIIALVLVSIIVLGLSSINFFSHFQVISSDRRAKLQNEVSLVLEHMSKNILRATGDMSSPGFTQDFTPYGETMYSVRVDLDNPTTPNDYGNDTTVGYALDARPGHGGELFFCPDTDFDHRAGQDGGPIRHEILSTHIPPGAFSVLIVNAPSGGGPIGLDITLSARWNISAAASVDNPEVIMHTIVYSHSMSAK